MDKKQSTLNSFVAFIFSICVSIAIILVVFVATRKKVSSSSNGQIQEIDKCLINIAEIKYKDLLNMESKPQSNHVDKVICIGQRDDELHYCVSLDNSSNELLSLSFNYSDEIINLLDKNFNIDDYTFEVKLAKKTTLNNKLENNTNFTEEIDFSKSKYETLVSTSLDKIDIYGTMVFKDQTIYGFLGYKIEDKIDEVFKKSDSSIYRINNPLLVSYVNEIILK